MSASVPNTLHWSDTDAEVHKLVVGPYDNNVFVIRCRHTGESVMLDAANEHEKLLQEIGQLVLKVWSSSLVAPHRIDAGNPNQFRKDVAARFHLRHQGLDCEFASLIPSPSRSVTPESGFPTTACQAIFRNV